MYNCVAAVDCVDLTGLPAEGKRSWLAYRILEAQVRRHGLELEQTELDELDGCLIRKRYGSSILVNQAG